MLLDFSVSLDSGFGVILLVVERESEFQFIGKGFLGNVAARIFSFDCADICAQFVDEGLD